MSTSCKRCGGSGFEPNWRALGDAIRAARMDRGWGLRELARRAEVTPAYICDIEHGRRGGGLSGKGTNRILNLLRIDGAEIISRAAQPEGGQ